MAGRLDRIREYVNAVLDGMESTEQRRAAGIHSYGVSQCCAILASRRGLNMELATAIGLLHDVYAYKTGVLPLHAQNGAEMIRVAFKYSLADLFTKEEQIIILSAIHHHSDKAHVHDAYDELLKDGDVLQRLSFADAYEWSRGQRLLHILKALSLSVPGITVLPKAECTAEPFMQFRVADIAEALAEKKIRGEREDADYLNIIRYYPEATAFDELKNGWCAAFVYHCCLEAGLSLPIRVPHTAKAVGNCRFAGVGAWYEWGTNNGFCRFAKDGFVPERGDIPVYNNIIPKANKPADSAWHDHIGIVLSSDGDDLVVAEGNVNNENVSGIVRRKRDDRIACYIRIPHSYAYDGWKVDFKTGEEKVKAYLGK